MTIQFTFIIYFFIIFAIAVRAYRATKSHADFVLGGRELNSAVTAMGVGASDMGSWLMLALPGAIYFSGLNQIWLVFGLVIGAYLNWRLVAKRLRVYTEIANNSLTIPSYFENRFQDKSRLLRLVIALIIVLFFTVYSAAGLVGGAKLFASSFAISYTQGLILCALIVVSYTSVGGFLAVNWIDLFQGALMLFALIVLPIFVFHQLGGVIETAETISEINSAYSQIFHNMTLLSVLSLLAWGLGYFGQPHILVRFMAAKKAKYIKKARRICMAWMILALVGAVLVGYTGIAYFSGHPLQSEETVFLQLAHDTFYLWIVGLFLAAVLSAVLSSIAAQLLACSSSIAEDGYRAFIRTKAGNKELIWVGRLAVVVVMIIAFILAFNPDSRVLDLVAYAWAGLGATFGPPIILSLFWKYMTKNGAILGMILGATTVMLWHLLAHYWGGIFNLYEILPGFIASTVGVILGSYYSATVHQGVRQQFNYYKNQALKYSSQ